MKKILLAIFVLFSFLSLTAQQIQTENYSNTETCGNSLIQSQMLNNPTYAAKMNAFEAMLANPSTTRIGATYVIPVVVHVMHKGEAIGIGTNISDEAILAKIQAINEEYRKIPGTYGDGNGVDTGISFALAVKDPSGNCTSGIDRVNMSAYSNYMTSGVRLNSSNGMTDTALKVAAYWDSNNYYNIWVVSGFDGIFNGTGTLGYAQLAAAHGTAIDGAVLVSHSFKDTGSKSESHELGHALNLYHTFEGDGTGNTCPVANGCGSGAGDCCADTPPHKRSTSPCNTSGTNSCDANSSNALFANNYMDYSSNGCRNMFTANQKTRMTTALTAVRGSYLAVNGNDKLVPTGAPTAGFLVDAQAVCVGSTVKFRDHSACIPNTFQNDDVWPDVSFNWTLTKGSNTYTSTLQNPEFTLTETGFYDLTYTVTNAFGSNTITIFDAVVVSEPAAVACIPHSQYEGFYGSTVNEVTFNTIQNFSSVMTNTAYTDLSCSKSTVVLGGMTYPLTITYKSGNTYAETLEVYIDYNNNGTFETNERVLVDSIAAGLLSTVTVDITIADPAVHYTLLRMRVIGEATTISAAQRNCTANYFTSDIKDFGVYVAPVLAVNSFENNQIHYFPNPVSSELTINATHPIEKISIHNLIGQLVYEAKNKPSISTVDFSELPKGVYVVSVISDYKTSSFKIIRE